MRIVGFLASIIFFGMASGCASSYFLSGDGSLGVRTEKLGEGEYRISATGSGTNSIQDVISWIHLRAEELCGQDNFVLTDEKRSDTMIMAYTPAVLVPVSYAGYSQNCKCSENWPDKRLLNKGYPDFSLAKEGLSMIVIYNGDSKFLNNNIDGSVRIRLDGKHLASLPAKSFIYFFIDKGVHIFDVNDNYSSVFGGSKAENISKNTYIFEVRNFVRVSLSEKPTVPAEFSTQYEPYVE